jgi:hypothetical protein
MLVSFHGAYRFLPGLRGARPERVRNEGLGDSVVLEVEIICRFEGPDPGLAIVGITAASA